MFELLMFAVCTLGILAFLAYVTTMIEPRDFEEPTPEQVGVLARAVSALIDTIGVERL